MDKKTLDTFARHFETGETLPDDLYHKIKQAKNFQSGLQMIRQLLFAAVDMKLHAIDDDNSKESDPFQLYQEEAQTYAVLPPLPDDRFLCAFSHIFAGGYAAGYYSYKVDLFIFV